MPITHRIAPDEGIMYVTRSGAIDTQDEIAALDARKADPDFRPGLGVLVDCRDVKPDDSVEVIHYLAKHANQHAERLRCGAVAIVVSTDVEFGMARMYEMLTEATHPHTEVFRDPDAALAWLRERLAAA
ncbi:MAG: hypothetical protein GC159_03760 [Phycisphaera sp.]|nr:hypothetical protein [Phycisphaera sp.]